MGDVDGLLCAGDAIFEYRFSNEVIELLRKRDARYVLGNHETVLLGPLGVRARSAPSVRAGTLAYMQSMPLQLDFQVNGKRLLMVHASPFEPHDQYLYPGTRELQRLAEIDADYVVLGHTHAQMAQRIGRALVINPGSAGDARDHANGRRLSYAVLDTGSDEVPVRQLRAGRRPHAIARPLLPLTPFAAALGCGLPKEALPT
jgi:putative phosphoesterase